MRSLYIDCSMGAAGDMLMASLFELLPEKEDFLRKMNSLGIPGVRVEAEKKKSCGITGTHMQVTVDGEEEGEHHHHEHHHHEHHHHSDGEQETGHHHHEGENSSHHHEGHCHHEHHHRGLGDISALIKGLDLPEKVKQDALAVFRIIAEAESRVHDTDMEHIHFHEVGTLDAVTDVIGNCLLLYLLKADRITASPVHVGSGTVKCAHGMLPVPAPATALILKGIPVYGGEIQSELCTPTGAALLKYFVRDFGPMPPMTIEETGYGMGTKEFSRANCVRVMLGEEAAERDEVLELSANLDDMTGEEIGFAIEMLLSKGALDVYAQPIVMKKSRPAVKLVCMCRPDDREKMAALMLKHTSSIGIREAAFRRITMERHFEKRETPWGTVSVKVCQGCGVRKVKGEYDELAKIAAENDVSLREVEKTIDE